MLEVTVTAHTLYWMAQEGMKMYVNPATGQTYDARNPIHPGDVVVARPQDWIGDMDINKLANAHGNPKFVLDIGPRLDAILSEYQD